MDQGEMDRTNGDRNHRREDHLGGGGFPGGADERDQEIAADARAMGAAGISRSTGTGSAGSGLAVGGHTGVGGTDHAASTRPTTDPGDDFDDAAGPSGVDFGGTGTAGSGLGTPSAAASGPGGDAAGAAGVPGPGATGERGTTSGGSDAGGGGTRGSGSASQ